MKNYELKYATKEFAGKQVKITTKRLAYLVPNMFGKLRNGFFKNINSIIAVYQEENQVQQPVAQAPISEPIVENKTVVENVVNQAPAVEEASQAVSQSANENKNYIAKAYLADIENLSRKQKKSVPKLNTVIDSIPFIFVRVNMISHS